MGQVGFSCFAQDIMATEQHLVYYDLNKAPNQHISLHHSYTELKYGEYASTKLVSLENLHIKHEMLHFI
jgi:hypothetical protein